jgi:drug/metabolite transporter (DMT)-like permease
LIGEDGALVVTMVHMANRTMPLGAASALTFFYALGYPIGALAVSAMSPMAVLVFRFGLAGGILAGWAAAARVSWPTGRALVHVLVTGLLTQALQFSCLYLALMHGAPAVLGAVVISMNPVITAVLAAAVLRERLTWTRVAALALGVAAVLAACAGRLIAIGGVQRFCSDVDFRASAALQNVVALVPVAALATILPWQVSDPWRAAGAVAAVVLLNATLCMSLYVRAINDYGAAAVAMLFAVIPAVAGLLSWALLGQRPDVGIAVGLVVGAVACWLNARGSRQQRQHDPTGDGRRKHRVDAVHDAAVPGQ